MSDLVTDPHSVGCGLSQGKRSERLNSSTSVSDLSEGMSDMSLSTSPGSDIPVQQVKGLTIMPTSPTGVQDTSPTEARQPPPRKRLVVRQLSSNPYLTSSEMSPSDDHPLITGSHSYAAGDSRFYAHDESFDQKGTTEFDSHHFSHRANSYPLPSHCLDESDEDDDEEEDDQDEDENSEDEIDTGKGINSDCVDGSKPIPVGHQNPNDSTQQQSNVAIETLKFGVSPTAITNSPEILPAMGHNSHNHYDSHQQHDHQQQQSLYYNHHRKQHHRQQQQQPQQQSFRNSHSSAATTNGLPLNNIGSKRNGYTWNANQNELYCAESAPYSFSGTVPDHHHDGNGILRGPPKSTEINSWGHFSKPSDNHYKYRRSHYNSSDSDEETLISSSTKPHPKQSNNRFAGCKGHVPPCRCNQRSSAQNPSTQRTNISTVQQNNAVERKSGSQNGIKPHEFKERFQLMKRWFAECNDGQKNIVLKGMLGLCELPQLHLLSVHMSKELHNGCPSNCEDIITWLPTDLATKVMSYLDPVSLCHAAQVCRVWRQLAEDQSLWRRFCCQTKWRLSKAAEHKQVISHMCPEGSIQWKNVFAERFRLRNNWLKGRCTVRTFEGHLQGISCVQFDDSRIVSGSSDKTIKVWNMRTNAPWSVQTLMGHHGTVRCLHLEGNRLVSGSCDTTIKVWDLSTQESWSSIACKVTMTGHADTVRCLQADDDKVISGSYDKTLKIWDLRSGELRRTLRGHQASVLCVHFSETKIVSGSADKTIKLWNYDGQCMMTLCGHQDAVTCLMFDSTRIVSGSLDHNLKFWDIHTGECLNTIDWKKAEGHTDVVRCLQADSWRVVSAADDKTIKVWNLATGERLVTLRNHTDGVTCLQFNDFIIVSGSYDKSVKLWDFSCC